MKLFKKIGIIISVVILYLVLSYLFLNFWFVFLSNIRLEYYLFPRKFDSVEWKESYQRFANFKNPDGVEAFHELRNRKKMVYSLIRSKNLLGKDENDLDRDRWTYWLYFTAADNGWLEIVFRDGVVVTVKIYED